MVPRELDAWELDAVQVARGRLAADPEDADARAVLEEAALFATTGEEPRSLAWFFMAPRPGVTR